MPDWRRYVRRHLPLPDLDTAAAEQAVEEVAAQLEDCYADAVAAGLSEKDALRRAESQVDDWGLLAGEIVRERGRSAAVRADGRVESAEAHLRGRGDGWLWLADSLQALRLSMRRMRRTPGFSLVVLLTLAIGIGANTAIFSVVNGILLKPLPFGDPHRLVSVWTSAPGLGEAVFPQSPAVNLTYEEESDLLEGIGLWTETEVTLVDLDGPVRIQATYLTSGVLAALGVVPPVGRAFRPEEDVAGAPLTALLSHSYWRSRFGGRPGVLGETVRVNGLDREVVGVLPADFAFFGNTPAIYLPLAFDRSRLFMGNFSYRSLARLKDGVSIERAETELTRLQRVAITRFPGGMTAEQLEQARASALLRPLKDDVVGDIGDVLWLLLGGVGIILIVACANVANLFLVRAESREREFAVRSALGARRGKISMDLLIESLVLGAGGGIIGTGLAYVGLRALVSIAPEDLPRVGEIALDPGVLLFTIAISLLSGLFFGLFPVLRYRRLDHVEALKEGGRGGGSGRQSNRTRNTLVVAQMAMALVLLIASGLMIRSFRSLLDVHPGFADPARLFSFGLSISESDVAELEQVALLHERMADRLAQVSGVASVGMTNSVPMDRRAGFDPVWVEDFPLPEGQLPGTRRFKWVSPGYFATMGIPLLAGREYGWPDIRNRSRYVIIADNLAREYWGDADAAIGARIGTGGGPGNWREIIGVVGDVRDDGLAQDAVSIVYWPMVVEDLYAEVDLPVDLSLFVPRRLEYVVRGDRVGTAELVTDLREAVWSINGNLPLASPRSLDADVRASMARTSFTLVMLAIAAAMALLLGAVGVYGVISYVVSQRTREIGVRVVLGAEGAAVTRMVLGQGLRLAAAGTVIGLLIAVASTRVMGGVLYGVSPLDPLTYGVVAAILAGIALLASYLPARRAAGVNPVEAIRAG